MISLETTLFILIVISLTIYAILDGFDLGVGIWHLFTKKDEERRIFLSIIGPFWDGNEVWLLFAGGAIFAAFPIVYATVFSAFYLPIMLLIFSLIFRAIAIDFRNKVESKAWRYAWDISFAFGSITPAFLFGVVLGNALNGLKLDPSFNYYGSTLDLLNPYSIPFGLLGVAMFATHGGTYIAAKTTGELSTNASKWISTSSIIFLILFIALSVINIAYRPNLLRNYINTKYLLLLPLITLISIFKIFIFNHMKKKNWAFYASSFSIAAIAATTGICLYPNLVIGSGNYSLNIANASSSLLSLKILLVITAIGMPLVLAYFIWAHLQFNNKD